MSLDGINEKKEFGYKSISVKIKYYQNGIMPSTDLICDFCGRRLSRVLSNKKIHYLLCEDCRKNFNKKVMEGSSVLAMSKGGIGIFQRDGD